MRLAVRSAWLLASRDVATALRQLRFWMVHLLGPWAVLIGGVSVGALASLVNGEHEPVRIAVMDQDGTLARAFVEEVRATTPNVRLAPAGGDDALRQEVLAGGLDGWFQLDDPQHPLTFHGRRRLGVMDSTGARFALTRVLMTDDVPKATQQRLAALTIEDELSFVRVGDEPSTADAHTTTLHEAVGFLGGFMLWGAMLSLSMSASVIAGKERQQGLLDAVLCAVPVSSLILGKSLAALGLVAIRAALWSTPGWAGVAVAWLAFGRTDTSTAWRGVVDLFEQDPLLLVAAWVLLALPAVVAITVGTVGATVTAQSERTADAALLVVVLLQTLLVGPMLLVIQDPSGPLATLFPYLPVIGTPAAFYRYAVGAPWTVPALSALLSLATVPMIAGVLAVAVRTSRSLGGWPTSLAQLREALGR